MPVSIPGMPVESSAGRHQAAAIFRSGHGRRSRPARGAILADRGDIFSPNNLPANAPGNGYADPNIPIPVGSVETDGGAFNVREGYESVDAAMTFGLRQRLKLQARLTADPRGIDLVSGWSPANPNRRGWVGLELSFLAIAGRWSRSLGRGGNLAVSRGFETSNAVLVRQVK
jgi:hypothetical protein